MRTTLPRQFLLGHERQITDFRLLKPRMHIGHIAILEDGHKLPIWCGTIDQKIMDGIWVEKTAELNVLKSGEVEDFRDKWPEDLPLLDESKLAYATFRELGLVAIREPLMNDYERPGEWHLSAVIEIPRHADGP